MTDTAAAAAAAARSEIVVADNQQSNNVQQQQQQPPESFLVALLQRMHPRTCLMAVQDAIEGEESLEEAMPKLLRDLQEDRSAKRRQKALNQIYELSDVNHKENR